MLAQTSIQNLQVKNLFPTPVVHGLLPDADVLNQQLLEIILAHQATEPSVARSNRGGWQSATDFAVWSGEPGERLLTIAQQLGTQLTLQATEAELRPLDNIWRVNSWANINATNDYNAVHHHAGAFWSGVYYIDVGGVDAFPDYEGALEFHDPRGIASLLYAPELRMGIKGCLTAGNVELHSPKAGQIVMFPSWLLHGVQPYRGPSRRVSVAFNLCL